MMNVYVLMAQPNSWSRMEGRPNVLTAVFATLEAAQDAVRLRCFGRELSAEPFYKAHDEQIWGYLTPDGGMTFRIHEIPLSGYTP